MVKLLNHPALQTNTPEKQCAREKKYSETKGEMGENIQTFGTPQRAAGDQMNEAVRKSSVVTNNRLVTGQ